MRLLCLKIGFLHPSLWLGWLLTITSAQVFATEALQDLTVFQQPTTEQARINHPIDQLQELTNLQSLSRQATQKQLPIMLLFSAQWCEYCQVLKSHVLNPMMKSGLYEGKWGLFRHVGIDEPEPLTLISGRTINKAKWAYQLNADLTPTVLFLDGNGNEVAERLVGISEITLFSALVHARLNDAYQAMGISRVMPATPELLEKQTRTTP